MRRARAAWRQLLPGSPGGAPLTGGDSDVGVSTAGPDRIRRGAASRWTRYLLGRVAGLAGVACGLVLLTFLLVQLVPGDPALNIVGISASPRVLREVRVQLGLNESVTAQFWRYLSGLAHGNLGTSFSTHVPVSVLIEQRLPHTAGLALGGLLIVIFVGFPVGIVVAMLERQRPHRSASGIYTVAAGVIGSVPEYITATMLIIVFVLELGWLPVQGSGLEGMILPSLAIGVAPAAVMSRMVRNQTRTILGQDYMTTARSKRLSTMRLVTGHVLPNLASSMLTTGGIVLVALLGATVIVENVFNIPGLGTQIVQAILASDYPTIQGTLLTLGLLAALVNLGIDILLGVLDPRVLSAARMS